MAKVVRISSNKKPIQRGTIVRLKGTNTIGIVYEVEFGIELYHVLWFDAKSSYSWYDDDQIEYFEQELLIKN